MHKKLAFQELQHNRKDYHNIQFGPNIRYRLTEERLNFDESNKLQSISLRHVKGGSLRGQFWSEAIDTYKKLQEIFEELGYTKMQSLDVDIGMPNEISIFFGNAERNQAIKFEFQKSASQAVSILLGDYTARERFNVWVHVYTYEYAVQLLDDELLEQQEQIESLGF